MLGSTLRTCFDIGYVTELVPVRVGQCSCSFCTSHRLGSFEVGQLLPGTAVADCEGRGLSVSGDNGARGFLV